MKWARRGLNKQLTCACKCKVANDYFGHLETLKYKQNNLYSLRIRSPFPKLIAYNRGLISTATESTFGVCSYTPDLRFHL